VESLLTEISLNRFPIKDYQSACWLNQPPKWVPDAAVRKKISVDNPARLYGFEAVRRLGVASKASTSGAVRRPRAASEASYI